MMRQNKFQFNSILGSYGTGVTSWHKHDPANSVSFPAMSFYSRGEGFKRSRWNLSLSLNPDGGTTEGEREWERWQRDCLKPLPRDVKWGREGNWIRDHASGRRHSSAICHFISPNYPTDACTQALSHSLLHALSHAHTFTRTHFRTHALSHARLYAVHTF